MIPATSASLPISDPRHPLCHDDCAYCREYYDDFFAPPELPERTRDEAEAIRRACKVRDLPLLRSYREWRGLTQKQLEMLSGVFQQQISELEQGTMNTRAVTATKLAVALGVEVEDLEGTA